MNGEVVAESKVEARRNSGFLRSRVVQVHPTLRCNLSCAHCYSASGPEAIAQLDPRTLTTRLERLRAEGYDVVSFSGGEPLMYRGLLEVATAARSMGYRVNLITNGLGLYPKRVEQLAELVSLVGVSIDGPPAVHERMRGAGTFDRTVSRLRDLRRSGIRFGIAHCVTRDSLPWLPDLLELCHDVGAQLLQLHPLTLFGRAAVDCTSQELGGGDLARLYLISEMLKIQASDSIQLQLDLSPVAHVIANQGQYAVLDQHSSKRPILSDLVNPVIIDERGILMPLAYGMAKEQYIAGSGGGDWEDEVDGYLACRAAPLRRLLEVGFAQLRNDPDGFVDWYGLLVHQSHALKPAVSRAERPGHTQARHSRLPLYGG